MSVAQTSPLAGKPAPASMLVNVPRLVAAYYAEHPDRRSPPSASRSAPRGIAVPRSTAPSTKRTSSRSRRRSASIARMHRIDGPLFIGMDTHALSEPAFASALEVLAANGVEVMIDRDRGYTPTPGHFARHPSLQPRPHRPAWRTGSSLRRRTTRRKTAASNTTRLAAGRPGPRSPAGSSSTANALLADDLRAVRRMPYARALRAATHASSRLHHALRRRSGERDRHGGHPRAGVRIGVDPLGGAGVHYWDADHRASTASR